MALALSALIGWLTRPIVSGLKAQADETSMDVEMGAIEAGLGQGLTIATLGGYRNIAANFIWIGMYQDWQLRNDEAVLEKIHLAVALNPLLEYFWIDGARIIANDMPVWEVGDEAMDTLFETEEGIAVRKRYGKRALAFLEKAPKSVQSKQAILREKGVISWQKLDDLEAALEYFGRIIARPDPPYYLSRVYAELLIRSGRLEDALDFLRNHYAGLPDDDPKALKEQVADSIEALEGRLEQTR